MSSCTRRPCFPDLEYTFKHALTHEVAYSGILQERRRAVHGHITEAIETVYKERAGEHLERLCYHAVRGELWDKAHRYLEQAGLKALARSANRDAVHCFEQALEALRQLPESREVIERGIDVRLELRSALHPLGEFDQVFDTLRKATELAEKIGDERRQGRVLSYLAQSFRLVGDYPRAIEAGERALSISQVFGDFGILAPANFHLGQAFFNLGDHRRAAEFHSSNIRALDGKLARDRLGMAGIPLVFSRGHLCWSLAELGRFAEGVAEWQEAMNLAAEVKHPFSEAFARYCGGFLYIRKGEVERAITHLEPGLAMCRSMNIRLDLPFVASFLGLAYAFEGRPNDGVPLLEEAVQEATALKLRSGQSWLVGMLAYAYMFADRLGEAAELAATGDRAGAGALGAQLAGMGAVLPGADPVGERKRRSGRGTRGIRERPGGSPRSGAAAPGGALRAGSGAVAPAHTRKRRSTHLPDQRRVQPARDADAALAAEGGSRAAGIASVKPERRTRGVRCTAAESVPQRLHPGTADLPPMRMAPPTSTARHL